MALLPLLGALVLSHGAPAKIMIQSQIFDGGGKFVLSGNMRVTKQKSYTLYEGVDMKQLFKTNKLEELFSPTLMSVEGSPCQITIEGEAEKTFSLKCTADRKTDSSVVLHADFQLGKATLKSDFTATLGQTYTLLTQTKPSRLILIKVERPA